MGDLGTDAFLHWCLFLHTGTNVKNHIWKFFTYGICQLRLTGARRREQWRRTFPYSITQI